MIDATNVEVLGQILVVLKSISIALKTITLGIFLIFGLMIGSAFRR